MEFKSEEEKQYYDFLLKTLKDGIIDESERKLLNKQKEKYHISDERALELEKIAKYIFLGVEENEIKYYEVLIDSLEDDNVIDSSEREILNDIKKDNNISDERASELEKIANLNVNKESKDIINKESKDIKKENDDPKKVIENKEDDIEEFDAEVVAYKKRKKKRGNVSMLDKVEYYAKTKRPTLLKLWIWFVILGLEIYFAYSLPDAKESDSILGKIFSFFYDGVFYIFNKLALGSLSQLAGIVNIIVYVIILFILYIIFHMLLIYLPSFISVMSNMGKKEIKKDLHLGTILISIALIVFSFLFVRDNNKELNELRKNVNNSLKNEDYLRAFQYIETVEKAKTITNTIISDEYKKVLDAITNKLNSMNLENIYQSEDDYKYVNETLKDVYDRTINKVDEYKESYNKVIDELTEKTFRKYIQGFIVNGQYMEAYNIINNIKDNLEFKGGKKILWIIPTNEEIKKIKYDEFQNLASSVYSSLSSKSQEEMNQENYDFINKEILAVYDKLDKKYKESYRANVESYKQNIDINRDEYLTKLMGQISNMSPNEARVKLNEVYHNSNREKERKKIPLIDKEAPDIFGSLGKESYKSYWDDVREKYLKELNKN